MLSYLRNNGILLGESILALSSGFANEEALVCVVFMLYLRMFVFLYSCIQPLYFMYGLHMDGFRSAIELRITHLYDQSSCIKEFHMLESPVS